MSLRPMKSLKELRNYILNNTDNHHSKELRKHIDRCNDLSDDYVVDKVEINHYSARDIKLLEGGSPNASNYRLAEGFNVYFSDNDVDWTGVGTAYDVTYQVSNSGEGCYAVSAFDSSPEYESELSDSYCVAAAECSVSGDANNDGLVNVADIVSLVNQILYEDGAVGDYLCGDGDGNGTINVADIVLLVSLILG